MQDNCILVTLGLPQLKVLGQIEYEDRFEVTVIYRREQATCPHAPMEELILAISLTLIMHSKSSCNYQLLFQM